jgi:hypothetical protein
MTVRLVDEADRFFGAGEDNNTTKIISSHGRKLVLPTPNRL